MQISTPPTEQARDVLVDESVLLAVVPPIGKRAGWGSVMAFLKLANDVRLNIIDSQVEFLDGAGRVLETVTEAFGLHEGMVLMGPHSERFVDDRPIPKPAVAILWRLNRFEVKTGLIQANYTPLRVIYLPLQVPIPNDPHIVFTTINCGTSVLNISDDIHSTVCTSSGSSFKADPNLSADVSGVEIQPGRSFTRLFSLDEFPGISRNGLQEMHFRFRGEESDRQMVNWTGRSS